MNNLKSLLGEKKKILKIGGSSVELHPIKVKSLPVVLDKIHLFQDLSKGDPLTLISKNFDEVIELLCSISDCEKDFVENLELPELIELVEGVIELNKEGFFLIVKKMESLTKKQTETGPKQSNSLSKKDTILKESRATA